MRRHQCWRLHLNLTGILVTLTIRPNLEIRIRIINMFGGPHWTNTFFQSRHTPFPILMYDHNHVPGTTFQIKVKFTSSRLIYL